MAKKPAPGGNLQELKTQLKSKDLGRLYIFHGEEVFLLHHYLEQMKKQLLDALTESFNFHRMNSETFDLQTFADAVENLPMMAEHTMFQVSSPQDPRVQEVLDRGNAFIAQIRACNDAIPGEEISEKISRMELIVRRIFERAEAHPEVVPDLKKLMDYYLPMTVKLLNAYADMDAQPVQGETIQASKKEIEATLDTLNLAFEKLLDDLFRDSAMDVSSDISVLNTLLAQEGLTEDGLSQVKKQQTL